MKWKFDGQRIKTARQVRKMTQAQLAAALGVASQQLSAWETGRSMPGQDSLSRICEALDCPPKFFFAMSDDDNHQEGGAA